MYNTTLVTALNNLPYVNIHILAYIYLYICLLKKPPIGRQMYISMIYEQCVLFVPPGSTTASVPATTGLSFCVFSSS